MLTMSFNAVVINIRSLLPKLDILSTLMFMRSPDIVFITETWCTSEISDSQLNILGYKLFRKDRSHKRGGGCAIYLRNNLTAIPADQPVFIGLEDTLWLVIPSIDLLVGCIYRPPRTTQFATQKLIDMINVASSTTYKSKIMCGDFNLPHVNWMLPTLRNTAEIEEIIACIHLNGWTQHVREPTRSATTLDLVFTMGIANAYTFIDNPLPGCDHNTVLCDMTIDLPKRPSKMLKPIRNLHRVDWNAFNELISTMNWNTSFLTHNPTVATNEFINNIALVVDLLAPTVRRNTHEHRGELKLLSKAKIKLKKLKSLYRRNNSFATLLQIHENLLYLQRLTLTVKTKEESRVLRNPEKVRTLMQLLKRRNPKPLQEIETLALDDGSITRDISCICEAMNSSFASSFVPNIQPLHPPLPKRTTELYCNIPVTLREVQSAIAAIKPSTHPGPDGISPTVIKLGGKNLALLLLNIFTLSLTTGCFPAQWKQSIIMPKHKGGPRNQVSS
ncbi:unnamed protein product, partial [Dicrocoelium dendriticum]